LRLLLDTHTVIWAVEQPNKLGATAKLRLENASNELLLSAATIWEIAIKVGQSKLSLSLPYRQWMSQAISDLGATVLPITIAYADVQAGLPRHHGDPFDRLLVAQAREESATLVSNDSALDQYGVDRIW
jgi:PIN domain nuclease of toxin-antitoxin system